MIIVPGFQVEYWHNRSGYTNSGGAGNSELATSFSFNVRTLLTVPTSFNVRTLLTVPTWSHHHNEEFSILFRVNFTITNRTV
jgi:hypothetical protein